MRRGDDFVAFSPEEVGADEALRLTLDVPEGARSLVLTATAFSARRMLLLSIEGPNGTLFDPETDTFALTPSATYNLSPFLPLSLLAPARPGEAFVPGRYVIDLGFGALAHEDDDPRVELDLVFQRVKAPTRLLGQVWVARGASLDAASLSQDARFQLAFEELVAIFDAAGFVLELLPTLDLGPAGAELSWVESDLDLVTLFEELESDASRALHFVLVDRIDAAPGKTVRGKTMAIGGPPSHPELARRGAVILALEALPEEPARIAESFAHEAAHYLGLSHTSEVDGLSHDVLDDTPECPEERATLRTPAGELLLTAEGCADLGADNLLFYTPPNSDAPQRRLTSEQRSVMALHPSMF